MVKVAVIFSPNAAFGMTLCRKFGNVISQTIFFYCDCDIGYIQLTFSNKYAKPSLCVTITIIMHGMRGTGSLSASKQACSIATRRPTILLSHIIFPCMRSDRHFRRHNQATIRAAFCESLVALATTFTAVHQCCCCCGCYCIAAPVVVVVPFAILCRVHILVVLHGTGTRPSRRVSASINWTDHVDWLSAWMVRPTIHSAASPQA